MGSLIEELARREAAARAEAGRLRARIEELTEELARAEEQVTRLAIAGFAHRGGGGAAMAGRHRCVGTAAAVPGPAGSGVLLPKFGGADACVRYLGNKREFLRYDQALNAGWPIATGVIEGACRHLIADRLNLGGCRWSLDGAEAILTLRAVTANGDFEEYWRFHLACEHQRLYPGTNQEQYALGA